MMKKYYRILFTAAFTAALLTVCAGAISFPTEVQYPTESNGMIYKTYELNSAAAIDAVSKADISYHDNTYHFFDMTVVEEKSTQEKEYTETYTDTSDTDDSAQILALMPEQKVIQTPDGFTGLVSLDAASLVVKPDTYGTSSRTKTLTRTYPSVSDMDISYLPGTVTENGLTYTLSDCSWDIALNPNPYDAERVESYNATATYSATVTSKYAKTYQYSVLYTGMLSKENLDGYRCTAIFEPVQHRSISGIGKIGLAVAGIILIDLLVLAAAFYFFRQKAQDNKKSHAGTLAMLAVMLIAATAVSTPANALSYTVDGPEIAYTAKATSVANYEVPAVDTASDYSKNAAFAPPAFGSAESYLPNRSDPLIDRRGTDGSSYGVTIGAGSIDSGAINPDIRIVNGFPAVDDSVGSYYGATKYTALTGSDYYADGSIGKIYIPAIGVNFGVYEGTDTKTMNKGAGHFTNTSIWDGNVCLAAHNRGVVNNFGKIQTLRTGELITLTTRYGTRTYSVYSVRKIAETDLSILTASTSNMITLTTCVANEPAYRYVVQAQQVE